MVRTKFFLLAGGLFLQFFGTAQNSLELQSVIPKVIPASPNAAAIEKFGLTPIDYSTGVPAISYPMWSWSRGKFSFSVGLNYHAGGYRVEEMASNVGLGWSLAIGGRVSRTVRGINDDKAVYGFMHGPVISDAHTQQYNGEYYFVNPSIPDGINSNEMITLINSPSSQQVSDVGNGILDGEQDIFSISVSGVSCRFVIDRNKQIQPLEHTNLKIEMAPFGGIFPANGQITAFRVTDDKGLVYLFDIIENQIAETYTEPGPATIPPPPISDYTSSWLLSEIYDPTTNERIEFHYTNGNVKEYEAGFSQSESWNYGVYTPAPMQKVQKVWQYGGDAYSYSHITTTEPVLGSIEFPDGSSLILSYAHSRQDFNGDYALTKIEVKNVYNQLIKRFDLSYSYYICPSESVTAGLSYPSGNDYSKRLRLDRVDEVSTNGNLTKPTLFSYNATAINRRNSCNQDYWGFSTNPARNNTQRVPTVPLKFLERNFSPYDPLGSYLPGADRRPDPIFSKAGVLERIDYPTGGFTIYEYETNRAFSEVNYYEDQLQSNIPEWQLSDFNQAYSLSMPGRTSEAVELLLKVEELGPRPEPDPNQPQLCIEESQDMMNVKFEVTSTDLTFSETIEGVYSNFIAPGKKIVLSLPTNKTYNIKFVYDANATCAFQFPFKAYAQATYFISPVDKLAGGLRVKKIISNDGNGGIVFREYSYNNLDGRSSASLNVIPNFDYYRSSIDPFNYVPGSGSPIDFSNYILIKKVTRTSNPIYALDVHNNSPLVYTRVMETEADGSGTERQYDPLYTEFYPALYPYVPIQSYPKLSGLLLKEIVRDNNGQIIRETNNVYNKSIQNLAGTANQNLRAGMIASASAYDAKGYSTEVYVNKLAHAEVTSSTQKSFEQGVEQITTIENTYDPVTKYLTSTSTVNSKNEEEVHQFFYSADATGSVYSTMRNLNMISYQTEKIVSKPVVGGGLVHTKTNFQLYNSGNLPAASNSESALWNQSLSSDISFDSYDSKGNLLQFTARDGIVTSFIWGYRAQYPVAKIVGKAYADVLSQSGINMSVVDLPSSEAAMKSELIKLHSLSGCLVTTFTFNPLVGMTSEMSPNEVQQFYEYDSYNRLSLVRDNENRILKKICYNYAGQPIDCGFGSDAVWIAQSNVCETNSQGVPTGNLIVVEQDMNPSSSTYGQNRNVVIPDSDLCVVPVCNSSNCEGVDKKCINGICETGVKVCTGSVRIDRTTWIHYYHYEWSDGSISTTYEGNGTCLIIE